MKQLFSKKGILSGVMIILFVINGFSQFDKPPKISSQTGGNNTHYIKPLAEGVYFIKIQNTGKYLGVEGVNMNNGARVIEWDFANQDNHKFQVNKTADGFYTLKAMHSSRYLNVAEQSTHDGAVIIQWDFVEQDNMKFTITSQSGGWVIKGKQSGKEVKLNGNINNNANGTPLIINGNTQYGTQIFAFETPLSMKPPKAKLPDGILSTNLSFRLPDGTTVNRSIGNNHFITNQSPQRKQEREVGRDQTCVEKTAKIDMGSRSDIPISSSDYKMNNAPGLMYDLSAFYGSDYRNRIQLPFGEKRNPIVLTASVRNIIGSISETVNVPTINNINQAISNLYSRFPSDPAKISSESLVYNASAIENSTEFFMKIGASAHYMGGSVSASMSTGNKQQYKYLYFEGTKVMFTIDAQRTQDGFFNDEVPNVGGIGYISRANYGVKIIGKVEIKNAENEIKGSVKAAYNTPFVGGEVTLDALKSDISKESKVFLYVVGGTSNTVVSCTIATIQSTIDNILRNVNYHTSEPISLTFSNLNGEPMKYKDLTNDFNFKQCTPNTVRDITVSIDRITRIGTDCHLYGDVWVELVRPNQDLSRYRQGDNRIFKAEANQYVNENELLMGYSPGKQVVFKNIPFNEVEGAEVHVYYLLKDHDDFDDDLLEQRNGHKVRIPNTDWDFYRSEIPLDASDILTIDTEFVDAGSGAKLTILIKNTPK